MLLCGWWLWLQYVVLGIVLRVGWILQWIIFNQWNNDTRMIYSIVHYVIGFPCLHTLVRIIHSHRKLSKSQFSSSPCLYTVHDCRFCCSQNAICTTCSAVKRGLCCPLYGLETSCVVWQEKHGLRVFKSKGQKEVFRSKEIEVTENWRRLIRSFMAFTPEQILLG